MSEELTEIVVKVNSRVEYDELHRIMSNNFTKNFNYLSQLQKYPNYIFINFYNFVCAFFSNQDNMLNDDEVLRFIKKSRNFTMSRIFIMKDINLILNILKNKILIPSYEPKKFIRTFEDFNKKI